MKIFHYTTIDTLALIIKNKTIRFNRLDLVDDIEESAYGSGPTDIKIGQYQFVSCWTKAEEENLSLWKMYTNNKGVRIALDEDMFVTHRVNDSFLSYFNSPIDFKANCFISSFMNEVKLYDISYVKDPKKEVKELIKVCNNNGALINTTDSGIVKKEEWKFQKESRFKITVLPLNTNFLNSALIKKPKSDNPYYAMCALFEALPPSIGTNTPISLKNIDINLDPQKIQTIEVMMGPMTSDGERFIVEALLKEFSDAKITDSYFKGKIRK